jgi:hypothetical protein
MKVGEDNFVVLQGWMLDDNLGLSLREAVILAVINGFSQDGESKFQGSMAYIQKWSKSESRTTAKKALDSLEEKGLIAKEIDCVNGVYFNRYKVINKRVSKIDGGGQKLIGGVSKIDPNNIDNNIVSTSTTPPINNLFDNINKSEEENLICQWLKDDLEIRQLQFKRLGLIENLEDFERVLNEQVAKFYEQCRLDGKGDIRNRGRLEVISHFNNWIKAVTKIKEDDAANRKDNSRSEEEFLAMLGCKC